MAISGLRVIHTRSERLGRNRCRGVWGTHIVGVVWPRTAGGRCGRTPSKAVDVIMVGMAVVEQWVVEVADVCVVRRHGPVEVWHGYSAAET